MNKTININLGGFFFHIDEVAYQKLRRYLESISKSLSEDPQGKNEIISDIEARISELLSEKITDARQVVSEGDIEDIIVIMGQPEDYTETEEAYSDASYSYKRNSASGKKLFRDGDDKFLGGVASGVAHYFDIDTIWVRLLFLIVTVAGVGAGILVYIALWILLPEAKTTAEKLQMEGEPVNIDNIEKKIREEFTNVSESVRNAANQASEKIKDGASEFSEKMGQTFSAKTNKNNGLQDFLNAIGKIAMVFFKILGKFIGVLFVICGAAVILSLIIGGFSVGSFEFLNIDGDFISYPDFFYEATLPRWLLTLSLFTLIGIPFLVLLVLGLRMLSSNIKKFSKITAISLLSVWFMALLIIIFTGVEFGASHANYGKSISNNRLDIVKKDTLVLKMINNDVLYYQEHLKRSSRKHEIAIDDKLMLYTNNIRLDVKKSSTENAYFIIQKESYGRSRIKANKNAKKIQYNYTVTDNEIVFDTFFLSDLKNIYKDEEIDITVFIPESATIYFDSSIKNFLSNVKNKENIYDKEMIDHHFKMTNTVLKCTDCIEEIKEEEKEQAII
ncbi:MAG: phage shock protein PspC (stress-responsive transcriptional regulator) [Polaribacter sp.]|jgi:phage shock protein PspC (stress-responsive transcriptional regulator)